MTCAEWLPIILQGSFSEIYVLDAATLRFLHVNQSALANLQYSDAEMRARTPFDIAPQISPDLYQRQLALLREGGAPRVDLNTTHVRRDGTSYPIECRLFYHGGAGAEAIVAIGNDVSSRDATDKALRASESRFGAMVSNTPGLVYQFLLRVDGSIAFPYLSGGCHALLGVTAKQLRENPALITGLILQEDRPSYLDSMAASAADMTDWNWEGRIWVEKWKDIKWINLRATPRALAEGGVQWEGIMTNITSSKHEQEEVRRSHAQLAELSAHIENVKEQERTRIAREIHDDLGGNLTAIKMALALVTRRLPGTDEALIEKALYVESLVDRTIETVHRIAGDLRPGILDFGIVAAIEWQASEFEKQLAIPCRFSSNKKEIELDTEQATALFRIFQEALTNIGKHAQASCVKVQLMRTNRSVRLEIADNGRGIAMTDRLKPKSFGIRGMVERAIALGGSLSVSTVPTGGTVVAIKIPLATTKLTKT